MSGFAQKAHSEQSSSEKACMVVQEQLSFLGKEGSNVCADMHVHVSRDVPFYWQSPIYHKLLNCLVSFWIE